MKKSKLDKQSSAYIVFSFAVMCFLITMFVATRGLGVSYAAGETATSSTPPASLTFSGEILTNKWGSASSFGTDGLYFGVDFKASDSSGNQYDMYCIEGQNGAIGNGMTYTLGSKMDDKYSAGLIWLLDNAYPNNADSTYMSGFASREEKKYVTQFAVWYYIDLVGSYSYNDEDGNPQTTQLSAAQTALITAAGDKYTKAMKALATDAKSYNDSHGGTITFNVDQNKIQYNVVGNYIESNEITVTTNKPEFMKNYTVSVQGNEYDAQVVDVNGNAADTLTFAGNAPVKIRIPLDKVKNAERFNLTVNLTGNFKDAVYTYNEASGGQRPIVVTDTITSYPLTLNIPLVQITKSDITNGKPVEGAKLSITDVDGNEIASWVTDGNPHYVSLSPGKYILKEITSPDGYELNTETINFEVKDDGIITKVEMKNTPKVPVPDTASNIPLYIYLIGVMILVIGGVVIYETVRPTKSK